MSNISFKGCSIAELSFANKLPVGSKIQLENKFQFNVKYAANNSCLAEMNVKVSDKENREKFFVDLTLRGIFTFPAESKKEDVHVEAFKTLFPYARTYISTLTLNAGIPPIIIPDPNIDSQSIYRFDLNGQQDT